MAKIATYNDVNSKLGGGVLSGTKCVTKEVLTNSYSNINTTLLSSYSNNQLIPLDNIELVNTEPAWVTYINTIAKNGGHKLFVGWNMSSTSPNRNLIAIFKNPSNRSNIILEITSAGSPVGSTTVEDRSDNNGNIPQVILSSDGYFILYKGGSSSQAYASGGLFSSGASWRNEDYGIKYGGLNPWLIYTDTDTLVSMWGNGTYSSAGIKSLRTSYYNRIDSYEYAGTFNPIKQTVVGIYGLYNANNQSNKNSGIIINKGNIYNIASSSIGNSNPYVGVQTPGYDNTNYTIYSYTKNRCLAMYINSSTKIRYPFYLSNGQWDTSVPIQSSDITNLIFEYGGKMWRIDNTGYGIINEYTNHSYEVLFNDKYIAT